MEQLPLNALRALAMSYTHGGIRAAARELDVAPSSISRHLAQLGAWLGVAITSETLGRRPLMFTPQGENLSKATISALRQIARAVAEVREAKSAHSIMISTTSSFAARWLLPRLPGLQAAHPRIEVSVVVDQKLDDLDVGEADLAIRMGKGHWPGVRCEPLMDDMLYPVMSPVFWNNAGRPDKPSHLASLRLLHDRDPQATWEIWRQTHGPTSLDVRNGPRFASSDLLLRAAIQGQGVAVARHQLVADDLAAGVLMRPIKRLSVKLGPAYWIVLPKRKRLRTATSAVIAWLKNEARYELPLRGEHG